MNDLLLLAALLDGPKHGYALKKRVGLVMGHGPMHNNLVYPLLKRFVETGWVKRRAAAGERGQTREVYALTRAGKQALLDSLSEFTEKDAASADAVRIRVGLFSLLDTKQRLKILQMREDRLEAREEQLNLIMEKLPLDFWAKEVVGFLRNQVEAERKWLTRLRALEKKLTR